MSEQHTGDSENCTDNRDSNLGVSISDKASKDAWSDVDFSDLNPETYPSVWIDREQWMGHREKLPFAPWGDRDHPEAAADVDARYKWGLSENYVDGEKIAMGEHDQRLDGRVFLQQEEDPFAFVDGDDVRDPETGDVHPAFVAILEHLGLTYADVSISETGIHAPYVAPDGLPIDGKEQASFPIDTEPLGGKRRRPNYRNLREQARLRSHWRPGDRDTNRPL